MTLTTLWRPSMRSTIRSIALGVMVIVATSCDTTVTNPGPVTDSYISDRNAASALVLGAGRALSQGMNWISYTGAAVTREIHPAGSTGSFGITGSWQYGHLADGDPDLDVHWEQMQRGRWLAEEAVRRLIAMQPPTAGQLQTPAQYYLLLQQAYLYAGFANKLLGENICYSVIDGGPRTPGAHFFTRSEAAFTSALAVSFTGVTLTAAQTTTLNSQIAAATGGRAAARLGIGTAAALSAADADAAAELALASPGGANMVFNMPYYTTDDAIRNRIFWSSGNTRESGSAYRAHTQWNTWYLQYRYGSSTAAPGTPVIADTRVSAVTSTQTQGDAAIDCCGKVSFFPEAKYTASTSNIKLVNGREMNLIRAEVELLKGTTANMATVLGFINAARANAGAPAVTTTDVSCASNCPDVWRLLKRERGIELWLEARRLGDFRRWKAKGASDFGTYDPLESIGAGVKGAPSYLTSQDLCFPVAMSEKRTNTNNIP